MPRYYYPYISKQTVEQVRSFDARFLKEYGYLVPNQIKSGSVVWSQNSTETGRIDIRVNMISPAIYLSYKTKPRGGDDWVSVDYRLNLTSVPCHFGGERWYFLCNFHKNNVYCGRRVAKLYQNGKYFTCRHCAELSYESCNQSNRYRRGYYRILDAMFKSEEYFDKNVKRTHYNGLPTKKYLRYLRMSSNFSENDFEQAFNKKLIDLGNQTV